MHSCELIGESAALEVLRAEIATVAPTPAKVLITGESGVGKERVARLVHQLSRRCNAPFLAINCAGVPDTLLESELFGHTRGSFTGADRDKPGLLKTLDGGTICLDEVGEMSGRMQAMLLRFLETGELQPVGSGRTITSDVRVIASTNRDLQAQVASGAFRADLLYRLRVVPLHVPPLRERRDDIEPLVAYWLSTTNFRSHPVHASTMAMDVLRRYDWPGNVRELRNAVEWALVHAASPTIDVANLPPDIRAQARLPLPVTAAVARIGMRPATTVTSGLERALTAMRAEGQSFWEAVYEPFMRRDLTRDDVRRVIEAGLEETRGSYVQLVTLFNMPRSDYKKLLNFLRKQGCQVPFHPFRAAKTGIAA